MITRTLMAALAALALGGCAGIPQLGSIAGGESKVFTAPEYVVLGKTQWDQDWIDGNIEAGIGGFGWKRPKPRPASFDRLPPPRAVAPVKNKSFIARVRARLTPKPKPKPAEVATPPEAPIATVAPPEAPVAVIAPPPPPRDPVDELLGIQRR